MAHFPSEHLDPRFSEPEAQAVPWRRAVEHLEWADQLVLATVGPSGQPHLVPLLGVWFDGAVHVCTGPDEQKHRNLERSPRCTLLAGTGRSGDGLDVVVEGRVVRVTEATVLRELARRWEEKYGPTWRYDVVDVGFEHHGHLAHVFRIEPTRAFAFAKSPAGQTTYRFSAGS